MFDVPRFYELTDGTEIEPEGMRIIAMSTALADTSLTLKVRGFDSTAHEILPGTDPGETIPIHRWQDGIEGQLVGFWDNQLVPSTNYFQDITRVIKPVTAGYVSLYAVDTTNHVFFHLAGYHPMQTLPQFRRYSVTNHTIGNRASVLALVKLRHVPLSDANDILPIDSLQALKLMVMAIRDENAGNLQSALAYEAQAKRVMADREKSRTQCDATPVILNHDYRTSLGRALNKNRIL
jgi:hypothetical protein